jgi:hypothetical protein
MRGATAAWQRKSRDPRFREIDETVIGAMRFKDEKLASFTCSFGAADRAWRVFACAVPFLATVPREPVLVDAKPASQ